MPRFYTSFLLSILIGVNIFFISFILDYFDILVFILHKDYRQITRYYILIIFIVSYFYFDKQRTNLIIKKYCKEIEKNRIRGTIYVWIYVILSFILMFIVFPLIVIN
jgi:hypothetical protein